MKKILSLCLAAFILFGAACPVLAGGFTKEEMNITEMPLIQKEDITYVSYVYQKTICSWEAKQLSQIDLAPVVAMLSPDNLVSSPRDLAELTGRININTKENWQLFMNEDGILIARPNGSDFDLGYFTYRERGSYDAAYASIERACKKKLEEIESNRPPEVTNYKTLYQASFQSGMGGDRENMTWGLSTFQVEEQSEPVTAAWITNIPMSDDTDIYPATMVLSKGNTLVWDHSKMLVRSPEGRWITEDGNATWKLQLQCNVSEDLEVESAVFKFWVSGELILTHNVDMSTYRSSGSLAGQSSFPFSPKENQEPPTQTPTSTATTPPSPTATVTPTATISPSPTATVTPTAAASATPAPTASALPTQTPAPSGSPAPSTPPEAVFSDVPAGHWAFDAVQEFYQAGVVLGYGDGTFGADDPITYEHFGFLLDRLFGYQAENQQQTPAVREHIIVSVVKALGLEDQQADPSVIDKTFSDCAALSPENRDEIAIAIQNGLVTGSDGKLFPQDHLTRAETVVLLSRAAKKANILL